MRPRQQFAVVSFLLIAVFGVSVVARSTEDSPAATHRIETLAWLSGSWEGTPFNQPGEEHWSAPLGGSMMGMFRLGAEGRRPLFEFLLIEQEEDAVVMRFQHFVRGYKTMDVAPLFFKAVKLTDSEVVFENPQRDRVRRITYTLIGPNELKVRLDSYDRPEPYFDEFTMSKRR